MAEPHAHQQLAYQEAQRQQTLNERYERLVRENQAATVAAVQRSDMAPAANQQFEREMDEFLVPDNEMTDYIQEEDEEEDPYYFVQPQQRPHGDIYQAARVGDVGRVR